MEDMLGKLQGFSISSEEEVIGIADEWINKGKQSVRYGVLEKLLSKKAVKMEVFKEIFLMLWKPKHMVEFTRIKSDQFLFNFEDKGDRDRVLANEPWHFEKALLVLKLIDDCESSGVDDFSFVDIWVQLHSLPFFAMTRSIGGLIGGQVGVVKEVDTYGTGRCIGKYLRVRIRLDIRRPLK